MGIRFVAEHGILRSVTAVKLDGIKYRDEIFADLTKRVAALREKGIVPGLATVLVGDDPASHSYVRMKHQDVRRSVFTPSARIYQLIPLRKSLKPSSGNSMRTRPAPAILCSYHCPNTSTRTAFWNSSTLLRMRTACTP